MNAEEPTQILTQDAGPATTIPEQARIVLPSVPRPMGLFDLIHQWQPMGFRIKVDLPFVSNDRDFFFLIRNGPFIPRHNREYTATTAEGRKGKSYVYVWNNTRPIFLQPQQNTSQHTVVYPEDYKISLTQYDYPPILSTLAESFRLWRGDMHYRIKVVASFGNQGYVITATQKNAIMPVGIYNEYVRTPCLTLRDKSYRDMMQHQYVSSDISMFRHVTLNMPYDYPVPWYDQYQWINNRLPNMNTFEAAGTIPAGLDTAYRSDDSIPRGLREWCGDNWILVGSRGQMASSSSGSVFFEIEYRAGENFQFSMPGLPSQDMLTPIAPKISSRVFRVKTIPNPKGESNGVDKPWSPSYSQDVPDGSSRVSTRLYPSLSRHE